jgi:hypothetical protein
MKSENNIKRKILLVLILTISAYFIGRNTAPEKILIKFKEKIIKVTDIKESTDKDIKKNVKIITRIIYKTDGTKIEEKTEIDNSQINSKNILYSSEKFSKSSELSKLVKYNNKKVTISVFSNAQIIPPQITSELGVLVQYPTLTFLNTGIGFSNQGKLYLTIGISF